MNTILWLASWYPNKTAPFDGDFIQRHARAVALVQPVHVVVVVKDVQNVTGSRLLIEDTQNGHLRETIIYYSPFKTGLRKLDEFGSMIAYNRIFRRFLKDDFKKNGKPALVHVHVAMRAGLIARWLKKNYGLKYLVTEHWTGYNRLAHDNYFQRSLLFRQFTKSILKEASLLLPVSRNLGEIISSGIYPLPYTVVANVADTSVFYYSHYKPTVFRFIHISSMNEQKNIPGMLRCFKELLLLRQDWECVMIGPADEGLKRTSNELGLHQKIRWAGELPYSGVASELQQASAFILFSRYENLPCVLIEAACCGLPVIAPRTGGIMEIVDPMNGQIIEAGNEPALVQAMLSMMENYGNYDRKKISETATGLFNYELIGKKITDIYANVLSL